MSNYTIKAIYKPDGKQVEIEAIDDYYGRHQYGYRTPDGTVYNQDGFDLMFTLLSTSQE